MFGGAVEIVLGVSMTHTTVSIALVEGEKADGVILEHDAFDISTSDGSATSSASDHVIAAVLGTQEGAIGAGHHLVSTGVAWTDHAEAAVLRETLVARGIEDVLLVSELHAAAALAQALGRAMGYDRTALMFVERDTATLALVETVDGSVVKVLSKRLPDADALPVLTEMASSLQTKESMPQGLYVVGSGVDVTAVNARLKDLVSVPVIAPEEPQLALARGAALASASAPRYDTTTIGLAYSQVPEDTVLHPLALADDTTMFLGHDDTFPDTDDYALDPDDASKHSKPFLLMGSSLTAIFVAGVMALTIALVSNVRPTGDPGSGEMTVYPEAVAPAAPQPVPRTVPAPAPAAPPPAAIATARLKVPPAPPPQVVVRNAAPAPAPAAPRPAPAPAPPPPAFILPGIPAPIIQWPAILQPPPVFNPVPKWPPRGGKGDGGGKGGGKGGDDDDGD
jgi:hypothetical protein